MDKCNTTVSVFNMDSRLFPIGRTEFKDMLYQYKKIESILFIGFFF